MITHDKIHLPAVIKTNYWKVLFLLGLPAIIFILIMLIYNHI